MNLGKLNRAKLESLAKSAGITREDLEKALKDNARLVARHGATHSTH